MSGTEKQVCQRFFSEAILEIVKIIESGILVERTKTSCSDITMNFNEVHTQKIYSGSLQNALNKEIFTFIC